MSANTFLAPSPVVPGMLLVSAITNSNPMIVSVIDSIYNTYVIGQLVHLSIPQSYGMVEADQKTGEIIEINNLDFTVDINSIPFSTFVAPNPLATPTPTRFASLSPAGSKNLYNTVQVPFHSLANRGN
jgi:hypothetical protein